MVGIVVVTHGDFGRELIKSAELIVGKKNHIVALGLSEEDDVQQLRVLIKMAIEQLDDGDGVLVLTDLFGGSPANVSTLNMRDLDFKHLTGINLPMLLEALTLRDELPLDALALRAREAGQAGIKDVGDYLGEGGDRN